MRSAITQVFVNGKSLILTTTLISLTITTVAPAPNTETYEKTSKNIARRSPLQIGLVAFSPEDKISANNYTAISADYLNNNNNNHQVTKKISLSAHTHRWVPGHVSHHAFIPAHLDRIYVPIHHDEHNGVVLINSPIFSGVPPLYRSHYGGFGPGVNSGGQGAGHGYHVIYNVF